jgi:hypothetical protein
MKRFALTTAIVLATSTLALAQTNTPKIDKRQDNQADRIEAGKKSGALNASEAARLQQGQNRIENMKDRAAADGKTTAAERANIRQTQNDMNKRIIRQKNDGQTK